MEEQKQNEQELIKEEQNQNEEESIMEEQKSKELGMGWFKFLIYFGLWLGALLNITNGLRQVTGNIYLSEGVKPETIYALFPDLKGADGFFGVVSCILGVFCIVTRFSLAHYKKYAPAMLYILNIFVMALDLISNLVVSSITGIDSASGVLGGLIGSIIILSINVKYFKNRKHLFTV